MTRRLAALNRSLFRAAERRVLGWSKPILWIMTTCEQGGYRQGAGIKRRNRGWQIQWIVSTRQLRWSRERTMCYRLALSLAAAFLAVCPAAPAFAAGGGQLKLSIVEKGTGKSLAARMHLKNAAGRSPKVPKVPTWGDHFVFDGEITLKLPKGIYRFELECGPEYLDQQGHFEIHDFADDEKTIEMKRFVNMAEEKWYSGDLDVERPVKELDLLLRADDLHVAHVFAPSKRGAAKREAIPPGITALGDNRCFRSGGGEPVWHDVRQATAWDLPLRIAHCEVDSLEVASARLHRNGVSTDEKNSKPRDTTLFPGPDGVARWIEKIYFHLLNCGLRIPPSAGSGSGDSPNPVGYNRVYVHLDEKFSYDAWLEGLRTGRSVITNGPMVRPTVEGEYPGYVFPSESGQEVELEVAMNLATREKIDYFEMVQNGSVVHSVRLDDFKKAGGRLPKVHFKESGWLVLRVVTNNQNTHRFAMTAPYYVEFDSKRRVSRDSAQFFLDWTNERIEALGANNPEPDRWQKTREFWEDLVAKANAE